MSGILGGKSREEIDGPQSPATLDRELWTPFGLHFALVGMGVKGKVLKHLVDLVGFEPTTSSMPWKRAPNCATGPLRKNL